MEVALKTVKDNLLHICTEKLSTSQEKKPKSASISENKQLHQFDADENFFGYSDSHDPTHDAFFGVDVDEAFVDAHLPLVPGGGSLATGGFSNWDAELLCW
jgi:hypothetical protein